MEYHPKQCACMNFRKTARALSQFYDRKLLAGGLRNTQFTLLATLNVLAPVSMTALAHRMGTDRTTLTRNVKLLQQQGFISDAPGAEDARVRILSLTESGMEALEECRPHWQKAQGAFIHQFGPERWARLLEELRVVNEILASA